MSNRIPPALPVKVKEMPPLPKKRPELPKKRPELPVRPETSQLVVSKKTQKKKIPVPVGEENKQLIQYINLENRVLSETELEDLKTTTFLETQIFYTGTMAILRDLMLQIAPINKDIDLVAKYIEEVDDTIYLPFDKLSSKIEVSISDHPNMASNLYIYLINSSEELFNSALPHIEFNTRERMKKERVIQRELLKKFETYVIRKGRSLNDYNRDELMTELFHYIERKYPYDWSIVDPKTGEATNKTYLLGGTAAITYERGRGICEGRSKLIKLCANSEKLKLPCYLVEGKMGYLKHCWNEYIDLNGDIIEYDASAPGVQRKFFEMDGHRYVIEHHEPAVDKVLKKGRL